MHWSQALIPGYTRFGWPWASEILPFVLCTYEKVISWLGRQWILSQHSTPEPTLCSIQNLNLLSKNLLVAFLMTICQIASEGILFLADCQWKWKIRLLLDTVKDTMELQAPHILHTAYFLMTYKKLQKEHMTKRMVILCALLKEVRGKTKLL